MHVFCDYNWAIILIFERTVWFCADASLLWKLIPALHTSFGFILYFAFLMLPFWILWLAFCVHLIFVLFSYCILPWLLWFWPLYQCIIAACNIAFTPGCMWPGVFLASEDICGSCSPHSSFPSLLPFLPPPLLSLLPFPLPSLLPSLIAARGSRECLSCLSVFGQILAAKF